MAKTEKDRVHFKLEGEIVVVRDECHEEVARYGIDGDCLNHFPGIDDGELRELGDLIVAYASGLACGHIFKFEMTPVL